MVGGHTTDYVNSVIHKVEGGDLSGGILVQATRSYPKELHNWGVTRGGSVPGIYDNVSTNLIKASA